MSNSQEDDLLLEDLSRKVSFKSSAVFLFYAALVSTIPIWLFSQILHLDLQESAVLYGVVTLVTVYAVFFSYKNCKFYFKHEFAQKREEAIRKEVNANNKLTRKEKDDLILSKKNEVADYEATNYSICYNNVIYLTVIVLTSYVIFRRLSPSINYILSSTISAGLIALLSTGSQQKKN